MKKFINLFFLHFGCFTLITFCSYFMTKDKMTIFLWLVITTLTFFMAKRGKKENQQ